LEPSTLAKKMLGKSFAEAEEFALSVYRQYILQSPGGNARSITLSQLRLHTQLLVNNENDMQKEERDNA